MAGIETQPDDGIVFSDNVAQRRDAVRAQQVAFRNPTSKDDNAAARRVPLTFKVSDFAAPAESGADGIEFMDFPKTLAGGAVKGVGSTLRGVGAVAQGVGKVGAVALNQAADAGLSMPGNPLDPAADATNDYGKRIQDSRSEAARALESTSRPDGSLADPSTWTLGEDPTATGLALQGLNALGSMAPVLAAGWAAAPLGIGARVAGGAGTGGAQGGGAAIEQARQVVDGMDDATLAAQSKVYQQQIQAGRTPAEARAAVREQAEAFAFSMTAPVSALGGGLTARIMSPAGRVLGTRGIVGQTAGRAGVSAVEEGAQETAEGVATQAGINAGAGTNLDVLEGSFGNAALGVMAGAGPGAARGAVDGVRTRGIPVADTLEPTDVMSGTGQPFMLLSAARNAAEAAGEDAQVMRYGDRYIVRRAPEPVAPAAPMLALPAPENMRGAGDGFYTGQSWQTPANAPRGIRNNNPGNIGKGVGFQGEIEGNDPRFATFDSPEAGIRALARNLMAYDTNHGLNTVEGIMNRWAPPTENDTGAYVRTVAAALGVDPGQQLDMRNPAVLEQLTAAIVRHENGQQPYPADMLRAGVQAAFQDAPTRAALPAPTMTVDAHGVASTANQRNDADAQRLASGMTEDVEAAAASHPATALTGAAPATASATRGALALPAPTIEVDAAGRAVYPSQLREAAQLRADMGLTPDVEAAAAAHPGHTVDVAAADAAATPSDAQKEAGNYRKGHARVAGLDISIENPQGSQRTGVSNEGRRWWNTMAAHYGYIRRTEGADGDQVDVFVRPGTAPDYAGRVYVIDQVDPSTRRFDEAKVMMGYDSREQAEQAYRDSYDDGWNGLGEITEMDMPTFKAWLKEGDTTRPLVEEDIQSKSGRPFVLHSTAKRAADAHGNADVVEVPGGGWVARPRRFTARPAPLTLPDRAAMGEQGRRDFLAALREGGGLNSALAADIYGDRAHQANRRAPGLFRNGGMQVDGLVEAMQQRGYIAADLDSVDAAQQAMDSVRAALEGDAVLTIEQMDADARLAYAEREAEALARGDAQMQELLVGELFGAINAQPAGTTSIQLADRFDAASYLSEQGIKDDGLKERIIERAAIETQDGGDFRAAVERAARSERGGDAGDLRGDQARGGQVRGGQSNREGPPGVVPSESRARQPRPSAGVSVSGLQSAARGFMAKLPGASRLRVSVVQSVSDIPEGARPSTMAEGAYYPAGEGGRIYLVADNLPSMERVQQVLAHEVVGHFGVEALLGERFPSVLADVRRLARVPDGARLTGRERAGDPHYATMESVMLAYPDYSPQNRAREVLARMAETRTRPYFLQGLYSKLRAALRAMGFNIELSTADLRQMVIDAGAFLRRAQPARAQAGMREAAASLAAESRRDAEPVDLPPAVVGQPLGAAGKHADHAAAKAGDPRAAARLVNDLVTPEVVEKVRAAMGGERATIVPVLAVEATGNNQIPLATSKRLGAALGVPVETGIIQSVKARRSALGGLDRIFQQPEFDGQVEAGKAYFLLDDTLTQGGTLAALASHIRQNGGRVVGTFALTGKQYSSTLRLSPETLQSVRDRYGDLETEFRTATGRGFEALTESEGRYLAAHGTPDAVRARIVAEGRERGGGVLRHGVEDAGGVDRAADPTDKAPPSAGLSSSGPMESRAATAPAGLATPDAGQARERKRGAPTERPGEKLNDWERRQRNAFLGKIGAWAEQDTIRERLAKVSQGWQGKLVQGVFDQFAPLKAISPIAYMQARLSKGADGAAEYLVRHGAVQLKDGALDTAGGKGLAEILGELAGEHDHFMAWIAANRAERLAAEWEVSYDGGPKERFPNEAAARAEAAKWPGAKASPASRERLFTAADIQTGKDLARGRMKDGRDRAQVYREALADFNALNRSVLDVAQAAGLIDGSSRALWESEFYVPFYRVMEEDATGTMGPGQIGGLVGQQAMKKLKGGTEKLGDLTANTVSNWSHLLSASMKNLAAQGALESAESLGIAQRVRQAEKGSVRAMFKGRERHYLVDDPMVMNALTSLHYVGSNDPFTKAARKMKHALTVGVTISPTFRVRNLIRDTLQAAAIDDKLSGNPVRNMLEGWQATGKDTDTWRRLMAGGGSVRFGSFNDGKANNVKRLVEQLGAQPDDVVASPAGLRRAMRKAFDWYQETGDRAETINRAAIYQQARKAGKSHLEASYAARDLMDFTAGGTFAAVRLLSQVVPFFNARLQGMYKLGRGAAANPQRFGAVTGAVAMASALLYLGMRDDDEYKKLPDWARNTYWVTRLPGTDKFIYIPKPFEVGALGSVVERATELAFAGDDYRMGDFAKTVAGILGEQLAMNPVPQIVKPAMEAAFNYDAFRERDIDSMGQMRLPAGERHTAQTTAGAVALGRALGVSPQRIEHLVRGYFGWLGTQAMNVADHVARPLSGLPENPRRDLTRVDNWFVLGDFVKEGDARSTKYSQRFYEQQREIDQLYAAASQARELGDVDRVRDLASDDRLNLRGLFRATDRQLDDVNRQIKAVERSAMGAEERRAALERLYSARNRLVQVADERARAAR